MTASRYDYHASTLIDPSPIGRGRDGEAVRVRGYAADPVTPLLPIRLRPYGLTRTGPFLSLWERVS
jgi:hypothetical protein